MRSLPRLRVRRAVLVIVGLLLAGWLIPPFFHAGRYRKAVRTALESQLGRPVELGAVTLRLLPRPGFSIQNVVVGDNPRFGAEPLARVESVECDLRWRSLWISRLGCSRIVLNHPVLNVVRSSGGRWNVGEIFHRQSRTPEAALARASRHAAAPVYLQVNDARINFTLNGTKKPFALDGVGARLEFKPSTGTVAFRMEGTPVRTDLSLLQPPGPVVLSGEWKSGAALNGPLRVRLTTRDSLLYAWVPLLAHRDLGIYGLVSADIRFGGTTRQLQVDGGMRISQIHGWDSLPPASPEPLDLTFSGSWNRDQDRVEIHRADATFAQSHVRLSGAITAVSREPAYELVLAIHRSRVADLIRMGNSLARSPVQLAAGGRLDGEVSLSGSWRNRRYDGSLVVRSLTLRRRGLEFASPEAEIRIVDNRARLLPARFTVGSGIDGVAEGSLSPALPAGAQSADPAVARRAPFERADLRAAAQARYELLLTVKKAPLQRVVRLARAWGVHGLRNLDATGAAAASIRFSGAAWPFGSPAVNGEGELESARLLVAGLTEPVEFAQFHFRINDGVFSASHVLAHVGTAALSGWLKRGAGGASGWDFAARSPHLSLEQASLWFAVLGYQRPRPILDLIPGLRSLAARRWASRNLFATISTRGSFESPEVTFHSLALHNFHAAVAISSRVARISDATFLMAGGLGSGSGEVDFRQAPALITAHFELTGLRVQRFASVLPADLRGVRGVVSTAVHLSTRGLTRQEMAKHLIGAVEVHARKLNLRGFDPVEAAARAGSLGSLLPERRPSILPALDMNFAIRGSSIEIVPARFLLSGALFRIAGQCGFDGMANIRISADLSHVERNWQADPPVNGPQNRTVSLHLTGPLQRLALTPDMNHEQARR
ncbi:MAG: AsmA family protein [Terriglobia bacterium]